jgi:hypothetical protein
MATYYVDRQKGEEGQEGMEEQEEIRRKLAALAAHKDAYDVTNKAMWHATSESVRCALWQALEAAHTEYMRIWDWLEGHGVQYTWNPKEKRYEEVPPPEPTAKITPIENRAV